MFPGHAQSSGTDEEGRPHAARSRELLLNWFRVKGEISAGAVEGLNNKIRVMPDDPTVSARMNRWKPRCITHSDAFRSRNQPIDSAEEGFILPHEPVDDFIDRPGIASRNKIRMLVLVHDILLRRANRTETATQA